jgi:hypothetical protein
MPPARVPQLLFGAHKHRRCSERDALRLYFEACTPREAALEELSGPARDRTGQSRRTARGERRVRRDPTIRRTAAGWKTASDPGGFVLTPNREPISSTSEGTSPRTGAKRGPGLGTAIRRLYAPDADAGHGPSPGKTWRMCRHRFWTVYSYVIALPRPRPDARNQLPSFTELVSWNLSSSTASASRLPGQPNDPGSFARTRRRCHNCTGLRSRRLQV